MKPIRLRLQKRFVSMLIASFAIPAAIFGLWSCSGKVESISIGMESTAVNSLIYIAADRDYFSSNGLSVTIKDYASGLAAVNGMLRGEVDIATASEFVIVGKALAKESIVTFGSIDRFLHNYVVARKDRGVQNIPDLKGKRIGVPLKTAAEFYLGRFLELRGMTIKQVALVNMSPSGSMEALLKGEVDAVVLWQPSVKAIEDRLGNGIVKWPAQNEQATYCSVISTGDWAAKHPDLARRFLNSLAQAEEYFIRHPAEAKAFMQRRLQYDDAYIAMIWPEHQFSLSLDQSLVLAMEDEARWMIKNGLTTETQVPDFMDTICEEGLKAIRPEVVNVIR